MPDSPRTRNPEATKKRILAAALAEFSAKGISGARVDRIATRARTNKRMLYHYFGSKEELYRAVLQQRLTERAPASAAPGLSEAERLTRINERQSMARDYVRLLMWEALERGNQPRVENEDTRRAALQAMVDAVRLRQAAGQVTDAIDAVHLVLIELAVVAYPLCFPQVVRMLTGGRVDESGFAAEREQVFTRIGALLEGRAPV